MNYYNLAGQIYWDAAPSRKIVTTGRIIFFGAIREPKLKLYLLVTSFSIVLFRDPSARRMATSLPLKQGPFFHLSVPERVCYKFLKLKVCVSNLETCNVCTPGTSFS